MKPFPFRHFRPSSIGLPEQFPSWRPEQIDALFRRIDQEERFFFPVMPTGSGKSLYALALAKMTGWRTMVLTATNNLLGQYDDDFRSSGLVSVMGQSNYPCVAVDRGGFLFRYQSLGRTVDRGPCHSGVRCALAGGGCLYFDQVRAVADADIGLTNYDYWLSIGKALRSGKLKEDPLGAFDALVCDEGHAAAAKVSEALTVELDLGQFQKWTGLRPLIEGASVADWRALAAKAAEVADQIAADIRREVAFVGLTREAAEASKAVKSLRQSLEAVTEAGDDWIVTREKRQRRSSPPASVVRFEPVWPTADAESVLFRQIPNVVVMSATTTPADPPRLGIRKQELSFVEYPSSFPVSHRPVIVFVPEAKSLRIRVDHNMSESDERIWIGFIDRIIEERLELGRAGLIHCVSYKRAKRILELSRHRKRIVAHFGSSDLKEALREFRDPKSRRKVMLSPSLTEGVNLPGDECRWILFPKLPFPDMRSAVMQARKAADPDHQGALMMRALAQGVGRGVRSRPDWCESIILDGHAGWALNRYQKYAPKSFNEAVRWERELPAPMPVPDDIAA